MHLPDPDQAGLFHIVGIGGIGMSAIAEVMHTRGYHVQGSDLKDSANLERLRARGITCLIGHDPDNVKGAGHLVISSAVKAGNPGVRSGQGARPSHHSPRRDAGRADASLRHRVDHRHARQDHHHLAHRRSAQGRRSRSHRDRRRHHQCLGHQCPHRQGRMDGGRGRRVRRHVLEASDPDRRRHQYRPRAHGLLAVARRAASGLPPIHRCDPVLWPRRRLHRSSGGARAARQAWWRRQWPPHADLWRGARRRYQARQSASRSQPDHLRRRSRPGR